MNLDEVVGEIVESRGSRVILHLPAETIQNESSPLPAFRSMLSRDGTRGRHMQAEIPEKLRHRAHNLIFTA
jgi:hypothetical protein